MSDQNGKNSGGISSLFYIGAIGLFIIAGYWATNEYHKNSNTELAYDGPSYEEPEAAHKVNENWNYGSSRDEMRQSVSNFASTESENIVNFEFPYHGGSTMKLVVLHYTDMAAKGYVYLEISKGQFNGCVDKCLVSYKFDDDEVDFISAWSPSDGSTDSLIIGGIDEFVDRLTKSNKLIVEATFYSEGPKQFTFNTSGLNWGSFN